MKKMAPTREQVAASHCGAGCTLGDVIAGAGLFAIGGKVATFLGGSEFGTKLFVDVVLAYSLGISGTGLPCVLYLIFTINEPEQFVLIL